MKTVSIFISAIVAFYFAAGVYSNNAAGGDAESVTRSRVSRACDQNLIKEFLSVFPENKSPSSDNLLCSAATEYSSMLASMPVLPSRLDPILVRPFLWKHGKGDFHFLPLTVTLTGTKLDAGVLRQFAESVTREGCNSCGIGQSEIKSNEGRITTVICVRGSAGISSVPLRVAVGSALPLKGRLARGYKNPRIFVSAPSGIVSKTIPAIKGGGSFSANLRLDGGMGKYMVEVMADGPEGGEVIFLLPVYMEMSPVEANKDLSILLEFFEPDEYVDEAGAEYLIAESVRKERKKMELSPLIVDGAVSEAARLKCRAMIAKEKFVHDIKGKSKDDVLSTAGVEYSSSLENIAVNVSPAAAHYMLMASPAHRANVINPAMTHFGVGVVKLPDSDEFCITELFVRKGAGGGI